MLGKIHRVPRPKWFGDPSLNELAVIIAWVAWGALHSALATTGGRRLLFRVSTASESTPHRVRLAYNLMAGITLMIPAAVYMWANVSSPTVVDWPDYLVALQAVIVLAAVLLFVLTARVYDMREFLGLPGPMHIAMADLTFDGPLRIVRHPWYLGILLLIWSRDLTSVDIALNIAVSAYLVVGTILEERKLVAAYGQKYSDYQKSTPMLLPLVKR